jgi:hypothetical protein
VVEMKFFLWGTLASACLVACLLFMRYWSLTCDRLFLFFALAFLALTTNWVALAVTNPPLETGHYVYLLRLVAFSLIIIGIVDKNRRDRAERDPGH